MPARKIASPIRIDLLSDEEKEKLAARGERQFAVLREQIRRGEDDDGGSGSVLRPAW